MTSESLFFALVEANVCLAAFAVFYFGIIQNLTHVKWSRILILASLVVGMIIPAINIELTEFTIIPKANVLLTLSDLFPLSATIDEQQFVYQQRDDSLWTFIVDQWSTIILILLGMGMIWNLSLLVGQWVSLKRELFLSSYYQESLGVYVSPTFPYPCSYGDRIYIPATLLNLPDNELRHVIEHELEHIKLHHHFDNWLMAIIKPIFWYNPFVQFLFKELKAIHEFEVDLTFKDAGLSESYSKLLLNLHQHVTHSYAWVTPFSQSLIKKRVKRLNQPKSNLMKKGLFFLFLPVVAGLFYAFSIHHTTKIEVEANPVIQPLQSSEFMLPMDAASITRYSPFGMRKEPESKKEILHRGIDLAAAKGTSVYASASGKVDVAQLSDEGYGNQIMITHEEGYSSRYAHLDRLAVAVNEDVEQGDLIGYCGNSGKSYGPHLHFEIIKNGTPVDPESLVLLSPESFFPTPDKKMLTVLIDPGHGGEDHGASAAGILEKDLTYSYAKELERELTKRGVVSKVIRDEDETMPLADRSEVGSELGEVLYLSIHFNDSEETDVEGIELYVSSKQDGNQLSSKRFAKLFGNTLKQESFVFRGTKTAEFYLLSKNEYPTVFLELGFLSSSKELNKILSDAYRRDLCKAIASSIGLYAQ